MKQLLHNLIDIPVLFGYVVIGAIIIALILVAIGFRLRDYYYNNDKNPYFISAAVTGATLIILYLFLVFRISYIDDHSLEYVTVRKETDSIVVDSTSSFINNKKLPIKQQFGDTIIVEYNGVDYVIYDYQLKSKND